MTVPAWTTKTLAVLITVIALTRLLLMSAGIELDSVKLSSLLAFILSGQTLFSLSSFRQGRRDWPSVIIPITTMAILILMATLLIFRLLDQGSAFELFFSQSIFMPGLMLGEPTTYTMINFLLIATASVGAIYSQTMTRLLLPLTVFVIITTISLSVLTNLETAMPQTTIVLFILVALQLLLVLAQKEEL